MDATLHSSPREKFLKWLIGLFIVFHFIMVILGASEIQIFPQSTTASIQEIYGDLTGASTGFKFFAPDVGLDYRTTFEIHPQVGPAPLNLVDQSINSESQLRMRGIIHQFWSESNDEKLRRSIAASWAGKMFARYPESQTIEVKVESYHLPTMAEWREGKKPFWEHYYKAKFNR